MLPETMPAMCELLNRGGTNYTVFLRSSDVAVPGDRQTAELVQAALGTEAVSGTSGNYPRALLAGSKQAEARVALARPVLLCIRSPRTLRLVNEGW